MGSCCLTPAERGNSVWRSLASLREAICPLAKGTGEVSLPFPILKLHAGPQEGPRAFQLGPEFCLNWAPPHLPQGLGPPHPRPRWQDLGLPGGWRGACEQVQCSTVTPTKTRLQGRAVRPSRAAGDGGVRAGGAGVIPRAQGQQCWVPPSAWVKERCIQSQLRRGKGAASGKRRIGVCVCACACACVCVYVHARVSLNH